MGCCGSFQVENAALDCCGAFRPNTAIVAPGILNIIATANIVAGWDAADLAATPVALWPDASGNGFDLAQASGVSQPSWAATTGAGGNPAVLFNGVGQFMLNAALDLPAPGTTPTFYWGVLRQVTWTANDRLWASGVAGTNLAVFQSFAPNGLTEFNAVFGLTNFGLPLNTYRRIETYFSNSTADYLKVGSTSSVGVNTGNNDPAATFILGASPIGQLSNIEVCELWIFNALPSPAQLFALDLYVQTRYGAGLT